VREEGFCRVIDVEASKMGTHKHIEKMHQTRSGVTVGNTDRLKDQLLPILAHELRQPLQSILFALDAARSEYSDELAARKTREIVLHKARHMSRIIDDLLDIFSSARRRLRLNIALVDLAAIVQDAIETVQEGLVSRGHQLSVLLPPEPLSLLADASRLEQILTNLLTNAVKYTGPSGHIRLTVMSSTDVVVIRVTVASQIALKSLVTFPKDREQQIFCLSA
jgi:signal transduction histidine kinase